MRPQSEIDELTKQGISLENQCLSTRHNDAKILGWYYGDIVEVDEAITSARFEHWCVAYSKDDHWLQHPSSPWERERAGAHHIQIKGKNRIRV
jgi:hypothetical protein